MNLVVSQCIVELAAETVTFANFGLPNATGLTFLLYLFELTDSW